MCYALLLSTTSADDLSRFNDELVRFSAELPPRPEVQLLQHPFRWYLGSKSGCSCTFRHLHAIDLGFGEPVDWYPEDRDEIQATGQVVRIIRQLIEVGHGVDLIDLWLEDDQVSISPALIQVDLDEVTDAAFRFFENTHFAFSSSIPGPDIE